MDALATILLVEDDHDDAELILYAFRKAGITNPIQWVEDGDAAIAYLDGNGPFAERARYPLPALILLDLKLPRRSGFEVLAHVRNGERTKHTPVVVLTSSNQSADVHRAYTLCANSYLVKPVSRDGLLAMVNALNHYWITLNQPAAA